MLIQTGVPKAGGFHSDILDDLDDIEKSRECLRVKDDVESSI
jgi:hypothetical protein